MNFQNFSAALIRTMDLDPDYPVIKAMSEGMTTQQQIEWFIHKIFIYDTASEVQVYLNGKDITTVPFGNERRKSRASARININTMISDFDLEIMPKDYEGAAKYLQTFPGVGAWASWKFCDLLERVAEIPIDFSNVDFRKAYSYPLKGLCNVNGEPDEYIKNLSDDLTYELFMHIAESQLGQILNWEAPPRGGRKINIQEIETCLCKYHSFLGGRYKIGQDTAHLIHRFKQEGLKMPIDFLKLHPTALDLK